MKGNKMVKVKEFVKKRRYVIIGGVMAGIGCAIGWYGRGKQLGDVIQSIDRCRKGSNYVFDETAFGCEEGTVKGLSKLGERIIDFNKTFDSGSVTEDTKVTGVMVFMKKN